MGIPLAAFPATEDSTTGYFKATLKFALTSGTTSDANYKSFRFNIADNALIGYSAAGNGSRFAIANNSRCDASGDPGCGDYFNYTLPFAPSCSTPSSTGQPYRITILDPDNGSGTTQYGIQPDPFTGIYIYDVSHDKSGNVVKTSVSRTFTNNNPGDPNNQSYTYDFDIKQGHKYELDINHVYANNVIQFGLPFDSIYAKTPCLQGSVGGNCSTLSGYALNKYDLNATVRVYVFINSAAGDPATAYPTTTAMTADLGSNWTYGDATDNTPGADLNGNGVIDTYGYGYNFNLPAPSYRSNGYKGPWDANTYTVYMREIGSPTVKRIGAKTIGPCATENCPSVSPTSLIAGQNHDFVASIVSNNYGGTPLPASTFSMTLTDPKGVVTTVSRTANWNDSTNTINSDPYTVLIQYSGVYALKWTYDGKTCGPVNNQAAYQPFLNVLDGDIAAGTGFGNGSCVENNADIKSSNNDNTVVPNYFGAGSEIGAWATGDITDFVSGMGIAGGTAAYSGHPLSFANSGAGVTSSPPGYGGNFGNAIPCVPDFYGTSSSASPAAAAQTLNNGNFFSTSGNYQSTPGGALSDVEITAGAADPASTITVPAGKTITLYVKGNVYIGSNILYGSYSLTNVPRFNLYVQGNIFIDPNVTELHGVYVAQKDPANAANTGNITTCAESVNATTEPYSKCAKYGLKVVGAVVSEGKLILSRTRGNLSSLSDAAAPGGVVPNTPAETFQYSPELWLNTSSVGNADLKAYTSLPPIL